MKNNKVLQGKYLSLKQMNKARTKYVTKVKQRIKNLNAAGLIDHSKARIRIPKTSYSKERSILRKQLDKRNISEKSTKRTFSDNTRKALSVNKNCKFNCKKAIF